MQKTGYDIDAQSDFPRYYPGEVAIRLKDGRELRHREARNRGSDARPLSADEVVEKFRGNAERVTTPKCAQRIADAVLDLDRAPGLEPLLETLGGHAGGS
jgi:2-methylcitrate dehydratase PrpD